MRTRTQRGAVSVLVVITMLMLILFGLLALSSALAHERLGNKAVTWAQEYYELDALAETHIQMLDARLANAELLTRGYMSARGYAYPASELDADVQQSIYNAYGATHNESAFAQRLYARLYAYYALRELEALSAENDFFSISLNNAKYASPGALLNNLGERAVDFEETDLYLAFEVTEGEEVYFKNISVGLYVLPSTTRISVSDAGVTGSMQAAPRYKVTLWQEWQREAQQGGQEFWSGQMDDVPFELDPNIQLPDDFLIDDTLPTD